MQENFSLFDKKIVIKKLLKVGPIYLGLFVKQKSINKKKVIPEQVDMWTSGEYDYQEKNQWGHKFLCL